MNYSKAQLETMIVVFRKEFHSQRVCFYCGVRVRKAKPQGAQAKNYRPERDIRTLEHVIPKSQGGDDHNNIVYCCFGCNQAKRDMPLEEFRLLRYNNETTEFFFETMIRRMLENGTLLPAELHPPKEVVVIGSPPYDRLAD